MTAADVINLVNALGPTIEKLTLLVTAVGSIAAWRQGKKNRKAITENTAITKEVKAEASASKVEAAAAKVEAKSQSVKLDVVHAIVNNVSTEQLWQIQAYAQRIYELTGLDTDRIIADTARRKWEEKLEADRRAAAKEAAGIAQAAVERDKLAGQG